MTDPIAEFPRYLWIWLGTATLSIVAVAFEIAWRFRTGNSERFRESTWLTLEQFAPCVIAGGMLTGFISLASPGQVWMLPGLWQIFFALGIFAAQQRFPGLIRLAAAFYLISGLTVLTLARSIEPLSPWTMGIPFGFGQLLIALILYLTLERRHEAR